MSGTNQRPRGDHQLSSIQVPEEIKAHYTVVTGNIEGDAAAKEGDQHNLKGLSKVNLFVGPNNSGKSRFLRGVAAAKNLQFRPKGVSMALDEVIGYLERELELLCGGGAYQIPELDQEGRGLPTLDALRENMPIFSKLEEYFRLWKNGTGDSFSMQEGGSRRHVSFEIVAKINLSGAEAEKRLGSNWKGCPDQLSFTRLYIPTLRGLRPFVGGKADVYEERVKQDYFSKELKPFKGQIFTGLGLYDELKRHLLGDRAQRELVRDYERFLAEHLFGQPVTLIPRIDEDVVYVKIANQKERPIYDLGDGVQSLIILTFPLFVHRNEPMLVFIEEPEMFLHPGMQRTLLKAMLNSDGHELFDNHQYFVATHSNHLLDLTLEFEDVSVFMLKPEDGDPQAEEVVANFTIERTSSHEHRLLEMLGTRASSVFLSNCTLWVEGITDRRYFAHFLKLYGEYLEGKDEGTGDGDGESEGGKVGKAQRFRPRQDYHYSFVEYSGGNITHWSFLDTTEDPMEVTRLCARLMLIADRDEPGKKAERHQKLTKELGERFVLLPCREVENLLTPETILAVLVSYEEDIADIKPMARDSYADKPLGRYIKERFRREKGPKRKGGYAGASGTIKDKIGFCQKAIEHMKSFEDLSDDAQALTKKMYAFIAENNGRGGEQ